MSSGKIVLGFLLCSIGCSLVLADAPVTNTQYSTSYVAPTKDTFSSYSIPSNSFKGYGNSPAPKTTYGVPAPSYGPPAPQYGSPPAGGYDSLRDFSTSADSAFVQRRLFNTSVALTVPLFSFTLPQRNSPGSTVDLANQAIFGLFSLLVVVLVFAVPILFTGSRPDVQGRSNDRNGILNHLMSSNKVFNFMGADFTNNIGLDSYKCLQKTICEAHKYPKKYGMMATPFQIFFPPPSNSTVAEARASNFQLAAKDGKEKKDCGKTYKCFFDILDLCDYMTDWWKFSSDPNYVLQM